VGDAASGGVGARADGVGASRSSPMHQAPEQPMTQFDSCCEHQSLSAAQEPAQHVPHLSALLSKEVQQRAPPVAADGAAVGEAVGEAVGAAVGAALGDAVGAAFGAGVGAAVGADMGAAMGAAIGVGAGDAPEGHQNLAALHVLQFSFDSPHQWSANFFSCGQHVPHGSALSWADKQQKSSSAPSPARADNVKLPCSTAWSLWSKMSPWVDIDAHEPPSQLSAVRAPSTEAPAARRTAQRSVAAHIFGTEVEAC